MIEERPDAILNIIDGTNLEPEPVLNHSSRPSWASLVVIAINMMDIVRKNGDKINIGEAGSGLWAARSSRSPP